MMTGREKGRIAVRNILPIGRRIFLFLLCACCAFQGCAAEKADEAETTIVMLMPGDSSGSACARVSAALSERTLAQFGFAVQIEQLPKEEYNAVLWLKLQSGNIPDIVYFENGYSLATYIHYDLLYPLSTLLEGFPKLRACYPTDQWSAKEIFRIVYSVPMGTGNLYAGGFLARRDALEEMGVTASEITTLDQLHDLLIRVRKMYPEMTPVVSDYGEIPVTFPYDAMGNGLGVLTPQSGRTVVNLFESEAYRSFCGRMHRWNQEGLIPHGISLRSESAVDQMAAMKGFGFFCRLNTDQYLAYCRNSPVALEPILLSTPMRTSEEHLSGWCLSNNRRDRTAPMRLLEWLYTDSEAAGILVDGAEDSPEEDPWLYALPAFPCLPREDVFSWEKDVPEAWLSPACGLTFHSTLEDSAIKECTSAVRRFDKALRAGDIDPERAVPRLLEQLKSEGITELLREKQSQLDMGLTQRERQYQGNVD